jgi:hypothetical protein
MPRSTRSLIQPLKNACQCKRTETAREHCEEGFKFWADEPLTKHKDEHEQTYRRAVRNHQTHSESPKESTREKENRRNDRLAVGERHPLEPKSHWAAAHEEHVYADQAHDDCERMPNSGVSAHEI